MHINSIITQTVHHTNTLPHLQFPEECSHILCELVGDMTAAVQRLTWVQESGQIIQQFWVVDQQTAHRFIHLHTDISHIYFYTSTNCQIFPQKNPTTPKTYYGYKKKKKRGESQAVLADRAADI